jgi:hypothetical protein
MATINYTVTTETEEVNYTVAVAGNTPPHGHTASDISSESATSGYVLTADGAGASTWAAVAAAGVETNDLTSAVTWANVPDANITETSVTQHEAALSIGASARVLGEKSTGDSRVGRG